jgi:hypothetical protein
MGPQRRGGRLQDDPWNCLEVLLTALTCCKEILEGNCPINANIDVFGEFQFQTAKKTRQRNIGHNEWYHHNQQTTQQPTAFCDHHTTWTLWVGPSLNTLQ